MSFSLLDINFTMKLNSLLMKKLYIFAAIISLLGSGFTVRADDENADKPKFKFTPGGRILMDGALFAPTGDTFSDGVALPDIRLGGKASYGKFSAKLDIGYGMNKLGLKDVYMQYTPNDYNLIRFGYFVHQFGLNAATSSSMKPGMIAPTSDDFFNATGRNLGVMYVYDKDDWFVGVSAFAAGNNLSEYANTQGKISVGGMGRFLWRPYHSTGSVLQVGISPWYQGAGHKRLDNGETSPGSFDFTAGFPTKVDKVSMLGANISEAKGVFKLTPELLLSKDRFALEAQYYYMNVNRNHGFNSYNANGAYGLLRCLILGDKQYGYSHADGGLATPKPKTLECVIGYNYTNANSNKALVYGGITNDYSVTFNYYINKYMIARLHWNYTQLWGSSVQKDLNVNMIQARIMFKF